MSTLRLPWRAAAALGDTVRRYRNILKATTIVELRKKFAGSALGLAWLVLQPLLFLSVYLFLFLVVFRVRFPGMSDLGYVTYVFTGLVPFLALSEALSTGATTLKQNMHMVRNVIVPIELIPVRTVLIAVAAEIVGLGVTALLLALDGTLSPWILALPVAIILQVMLLVGLVLVIAPIGVLLPDIAYAINVGLILLMFLSPIGFRVEQLPPAAQPLVWLNPLTYMLETFRSLLIAGYGPRPFDMIMFAVIAVLALVCGAAVFHRLKGIVVDYD